jgi:mycothiol synthase
MNSIKNAPGIPGLNFRHFQGENDYASIAAVLTTSEAADGLERKVAADDIAKAYQHLSNCDPYHDVIIAEVAGKVVGYTRGWWEQGVGDQRWYWHNGFLLPDWRRKGIGRALLLAMEQRLQQIALTHTPVLEKVYQVNVTQFQHGTAVMLEHSGYHPVRYYYLMVRPGLDDIAEFPLPEGVEIRPVIPGHYPAIWKAIDETSQDEWGRKKLTEEDYQEWLNSPGFQPDLWQVAWDIATNQVAGTVLTFINYEENQQLGHKRGYTEGIGVVRAWRRRGLARALISQSLLIQKAAGMSESALVVDSENPNDATRLYESCGFQIDKRDTLYCKPMEIEATG